MTPDDTNDRHSGVGFEELQAALDEEDFPATGRSLMERYGDRRIDHHDGASRFAAVFEPMAEETFESEREVRQAVLSVVGEDAVGRKGYSDRDPHGRDEPSAADRSF